MLGNREVRWFEVEARSRSSGGREMIPRWEEEAAGFGGWLGEWIEGDRARGSRCGRWSGGGNREDGTATLEIRVGLFI